MKTDAQLQADVIAELQWEPAVDAAQERSVRGLTGVVGISNQSVLKPSAAATRDRTQLVRKGCRAQFRVVHAGVRNVSDTLNIVY